MKPTDDEQSALDEITALLGAAADAVGQPRPRGPFRVIEGGKRVAEPPARRRLTTDDDPSAA